jgi:hypothetical protein
MIGYRYSGLRMFKLASRPGAAPGRLSFGDSAAQAGARPIQMENAGLENAE